MARSLEVHVVDVLAGVVTQRPNGSFRFEYDPDYAADAASIPLSFSMPLTQRVHGTRAIANWMWGLLPDNEVTLNRWAQRHQVSARNPFALLSAMGEDCPGAVQLVPPGFDFAGRGSVQWISAKNLDERIRNLMRERGQPELLMEVDDPDLEEKLGAILRRLVRERESIQSAIGKTVVSNLKTMARMGVYFEELVQRRYPEFPVRTGIYSWENYLPPLSPNLQRLVEIYGG